MFVVLRQLGFFSRLDGLEQLLKSLLVDGLEKEWFLPVVINEDHVVQRSPIVDSGDLHQFPSQNVDDFDWFVEDVVTYGRAGFPGQFEQMVDSHSTHSHPSFYHTHTLIATRGFLVYSFDTKATKLF